MIEKPIIFKTDSKIIAVIHLTIPREAMQDEMKPAIDEIIAALSGQGNPPIGPMFAHHLVLSSTRFDFEVGFPVASPITEVGRVRNGELPSVTIARTIYHGLYEGLFSAWDEFGNVLGATRILEELGLQRGETLWEVYLSGPEISEDPSAWLTELCLPLVSISSF